MKLRSTLNPEEQSNPIVGPTKYRIGPNQSELVCGFCNGVYYVDDLTFKQAMIAMEEGTENPFCCDDCAQEYDELSH
jgi:hypothetical protein